MHGVCGFLQDYLGVRWFMPSELFEVLPDTSSVTVAECDDVHEPTFDCRLFSGLDGSAQSAWRASVLAERDVPALPRYAVPGGTPSSPYVADEGMLFRVVELALWSDDRGAALDVTEIVLRGGPGLAYPLAGLGIVAHGFA